MVDADGGNRYRLAGGEQPQWSPGGKYIAFYNENKSYLISATGGTPGVLAEICAPGEKPDSRQEYYWWSSDGEKLAFLAWEDEPYLLHVLDFEEEVTTEIARGVSYAAWAPDSKKIVFYRSGSRQ